MNGGEAGVAMIVGGADGEDKGVIMSEIFDFTQGKFVMGPALPEGNGSRNLAICT